MTDVLLVRHATNDWVGQRLAGHTPGVHLNAEGRRQAAALAKRLASWRFAALYSSPLERALETAAPVAERCGVAVTVEPGIAEASYGDWTGMALKDLAKTPEWPQVLFTPSLARFPNGETMIEMQARAVAALDRLRTQHPDQTIALFSHADVIKALVAHYAGLAFDLFQRLVIDPASVTWLRLTPQGPRLLRLNDTGTLRQR